jgi:hypothetical protein
MLKKQKKIKLKTKISSPQKQNKFSPNKKCPDATLSLNFTIVPRQKSTSKKDENYVEIR